VPGLSSPLLFAQARPHGRNARPLATGSTADVYDLGDGTVLRRYRNDTGTCTEAAVMAWAARHGVPVPNVHEATGPDLVMDLIEGPTMAHDLWRRPWMVAAHARTLVRLQQTITATPAPAWLAPAEWSPGGNSLLHLDLHPRNVVLGPSGPVVIDWTSARSGVPAFDAARTWVLIARFEARGARMRIARRGLLAEFARGDSAIVMIDRAV
jgi:Ser/Thr protein kinase RdoA (MazF antagonist)